MLNRSLALSFLVTALLAACTGLADESWRRVERAGRLRVGLDPTYPPFEDADNGPLRGLDVDLARAIGADLGVEIEFVYFGYDGLYDALLAGQADALISALVISPERSRDFAFSNPYFDAGLILVRPAVEPAIGAMNDLAGATLAVELGSNGHVQATEWQRRLAGLAIRPLNTPDEALAAVVSGEADAALVDAISGRLYARDHPTLVIVEPPITAEPYALVVLRRDEALLERLNASLARLESSGELDQIRQHWLSGSPAGND
jgi:ABC-type amino acid transport substrate-binding protein